MRAAPAALRKVSFPEKMESKSEGQSADVRWCAVYAHLKEERAAAFHLGAQGFETFLPLRRRSIRHARRIYETTEAFFPRYLFVKIDLKRSQWRCINSTWGVSHLLSLHDRPLAIRPGLVEALQAATGTDGILAPGEALHPGQKVRILAGSFGEYLGKLERSTRKDSVVILIEMMDRQVPICINKKLVSAI